MTASFDTGLERYTESATIPVHTDFFRRARRREVSTYIPTQQITSSVPKHLVPFIQRIRSIGELHANWNGYHADRPSQRTVKLAIDFVLKTSDLPLYFVSPGVNGEVIVEFKRNNKEAEVHLNSDGTIDLLLIEAEETIFDGPESNSIPALMKFFTN